MGGRRDHDEEKLRRAERLDRGVYGVVQAPVLPPWPGCDDPPGYLDARNAGLAVKRAKGGSAIGADLRCFYSGVLSPPDPSPGDRDARKRPWAGTRDHLVPLRRGVPTWLGGTEGLRPDALAWSSAVANTTLGLAPLAVRLRVREWLSADGFDRSDTSVEAGGNLRWLVIRHLDAFRWKGRYPWSRRPDGTFWDPGFSLPFMRDMEAMEKAFLRRTQEERDAWIRNFDWRF